MTQGMWVISSLTIIFKFHIPSEMYAVAVEATWHMTFAPGVFRSSGIIA
jgi:hypothetical protein